MTGPTQRTLEIVDYLRGGATVAMAVDRYGVSPQRVRAIRVAHGLPRGRVGSPPSGSLSPRTVAGQVALERLVAVSKRTGRSVDDLLASIEAAR